MQIIADFHIHSKYSRATSPRMDVENLCIWAKRKGINLLGTGDFTHPLWFNELRKMLKPSGNGLYTCNELNFILTAEVCNIFSRNKKLRKMHTVLFAPDLDIAEKLNRKLHKCGKLQSDGRPIFGMDIIDLIEIVLGVSEDVFIVPAHIWTPWFSLFGAKSGFDLIEECFDKYTKYIHALETGLSSDPAMNWRLSALDNFTLISNSDSHSPEKIGREANVFNCKMDYYEIINALKEKDKSKFLKTVEFFPHEGKYHYDGHRNCNVLLNPDESMKLNDLCPVCAKTLTIGVMHRVRELADREDGFIPENSIPFVNMIPLDEIISDAQGKGVNTQQVRKIYDNALNNLGSEFDILHNFEHDDLSRVFSPKITHGILSVRDKKVNITPGYYGVYGKIDIFSAGVDIPEEEIPQLTLF